MHLMDKSEALHINNWTGDNICGGEPSIGVLGDQIFGYHQKRVKIREDS